MQLVTESAIYLLVIVFLLIVSELMVRDFLRGIDSRLKTSTIDEKNTISLRMYKSSATLWRIIYLLIVGIAGSLGGIIIFGTVEGQGLMIITFLFFGIIRIEKPLKKAQRVMNRERWISQWKKFELYRKLIESDDITFIEIINDPNKLEELNRVAKYTKTTSIYDPSRKRQLFFKADIEPRLRTQLHFLLSDNSAMKYSIEEMYVILFMLSEDREEVGKIAKDIISSDLKSII